MWNKWLLQMVRAFANLGAYSELYQMILEAGFPQRFGFLVLSLPKEDHPRAWVVYNRKRIPIYLLSWEYPVGEGHDRYPRVVPTHLLPIRTLGRLYAFGTDIACCMAHGADWGRGSIRHFPIDFPSERAYDAWHRDLTEDRAFGYLKDHFDRIIGAPVSFQYGHLKNSPFRTRWNGVLAGLNRQYQAGRVSRTPVGPSESNPAVKNLSHINPFKARLPDDILACLVDLLDEKSLRNFSLADKTCYWLCCRRLWTRFTIGPADPDKALWDVDEQLDALLRLPDRTRRVAQLTVKPCAWPWTDELLRKFEQLWPIMTSLKDLRLVSTPAGREKPSSDFNPLLHTLRRCSESLCLEAFRCEAWLRPDSDLLEFLRSQTSIKHIVGVDVFPSLLPELDTNFLPSLCTIGCRYPTTALHLAKGRPVSSLKLSLGILFQDFEEFVASFTDGRMAITEVHLGISLPHRQIQVGSVLRFIARSFPNLRSLSTPYIVIDNVDVRVLSNLKYLEEITCIGHHSFGYFGDVAAWAASLKSLRKARFRNDGGERTAWSRSLRSGGVHGLDSRRRCHGGSYTG